MLVPIASIVDDWKEKLALEVMPDMNLPVPGYVAYALFALGGIFLLVGLYRLATMRIFRGFFALVAALLVSYYPMAYAAHWWLFKHRAEQGHTNFEKTLIDNIRYVDWGIMGAGIFFGVLLFYLTLGGGRSRYDDEEDYAPPVPQPRPAARRPGRPAKDPFDFT